VDVDAAAELTLDVGHVAPEVVENGRVSKTDPLVVRAR